MSSDARPWISALRDSHERLAGLVASAGTERLTAPSYAADWTIAQVLSHLGSGAEIAALTLAAALGGPEVDRDSFPQIWARWDAKAPEQQAADCLEADEAHIARLEELSDADLARVSVPFFGMDLDARGVVGLRLGEHAVHTWDVAVTGDPAATVDAGAVTLLLGNVPRLAGFAGRSAAGPLRARLRASDSGGDHLLEVGDAVTLAPWPADGAPVDGEITLPGEALLRLVYGRLDAAHTPAGVVASGLDLDRVRKVFPGF